jgi:hypothetical protein
MWRKKILHMKKFYKYKKKCRPAGSFLKFLCHENLKIFFARPNKQNFIIEI